MWIRSELKNSYEVNPQSIEICNFPTVEVGEILKIDRCPWK